MIGASPVRDDPERLIFIDFEASGLGAGSWPIEVGLAWVEGTEIKSWSSLIRPHETWDPAEWSDVSARVHNIPRRDPEDAPDPQKVAHGVRARIEGGVLVCDAPAFDG